MAESGGIGYKFVSESEPNQEYICPLTGKLMLDPYQTKCCGNHISAVKAEKLTEAKKACPLCDAPNLPGSSTSKRVFTTTSDTYFQNKIFKLQVYCLYCEKGCKWEGPLEEVESHSLSCPMQAWKCQYCGTETTHLIGTTEHAQNCPKRPIPCDNCGTSELIPFCDYEEHLKTCPSQMVSCEFSDVGCKIECPRRATAEHAEKYMSYHQLLVSQQNLKITNAVCVKLGVSLEPGDGAEKLQNAERELDALKYEMEEKEKRISEMEGEIHKMKEQVKKLEEQNQEKEDEMLKSLQEKEKQISEMEGEIHKMKEQVKELEEQNQEKEDEMLKSLPNSDDRDRQVQRLKEQLEQKDDDIQHLQERRDSINIGGTAMESLQKAIESIRGKKSLNDTEVKNLTTRLEEVVTKVAETQSQNSYGSPMNLSGAGPALVCSGKLEKIVIENLKKPWGVAVGGDKLYVVDTNGSFGLHKANIQDPTSSVETMVESASISEITIPPAKCWYPRGVALDNDLNIILVDTGTHRILKFSSTGKLKALAGSEATAGSYSGQFNRPIGVSVDPQNRVFVCDCLNHRVQVLDSSLDFVEEFGGMGSGVAEFTNPWDVAFDQQGNAYVADCGNRCIKVFTPDLKPLRVIGKGEGKKYKKGDLRAPSSLCVDKNNYLYVADKGLKKVLVYDLEGNCVSNFGRFTYPLGIAVDSKGCVFVSDIGGGSLFYAHGRVQMFS